MNFVYDVYFFDENLLARIHWKIYCLCAKVIFTSYGLGQSKVA